MTDELRFRTARRRLLAVGWALPLIGAGCASTKLPSLVSGPDPSDAQARAPAAPYTSVTAGTVDHQPVEPKPWREMNDRVAPRGGRAR